MTILKAADEHSCLSCCHCSVQLPGEGIAWLFGITTNLGVYCVVVGYLEGVAEGACNVVPISVCIVAYVTSGTVQPRVC